MIDISTFNHWLFYRKERGNNMIHPDVLKSIDYGNDWWMMVADQVSKSAVELYDAQEENQEIGEEIAKMIAVVQREKEWSLDEVDKHIIEPITQEFSGRIDIKNHYPNTLGIIPSAYDNWEDVITVGSNEAFLNFYDYEIGAYEPTLRILSLANIGEFFGGKYGDFMDYESSKAVTLLAKITRELRNDHEAMVKFTNNVIAETNTPVDELYVKVTEMTKSFLAEK